MARVPVLTQPQRTEPPGVVENPIRGRGIKREKFTQEVGPRFGLTKAEYPPAAFEPADRSVENEPLTVKLHFRWHRPNRSV